MFRQFNKSLFIVDLGSCERTANKLLKMAKFITYTACSLDDCSGDTTKKWFVYYYYRHPVTNNMKRIRDYSGFVKCKTIEERMAHAKKQIDFYNKLLASGYNPYANLQPKQTTLQKSTAKHNVDFYLIKAVAIKKLTVKPKTIIKYTYQSNYFCQWLETIGKKNIGIHEVDLNLIRQHFTHLQQLKKSNTTINAVKVNLGCLFNVLVQEGIILKNPFTGIKKLPETRQGKKPFANVQIPIVKQAILQHSAQLWFFCQFQYYCFIRPGELRLLKIENIDFDTQTITIPGTISKNGKTQTVLIPNSFYPDIIAHGLHLQSPKHFIFGKDGVPGPKTKSRDYFNKEHKKVLEQFNYGMYYTLYSWKNTGAKAVAKAGINIKDLQNQLRHHSLEMVDTYLKSLGIIDATDIKTKFPAI